MRLRLGDNGLRRAPIAALWHLLLQVRATAALEVPGHSQDDNHSHEHKQCSECDKLHVSLGVLRERGRCERAKQT